MECVMAGPGDDGWRGAPGKNRTVTVLQPPPCNTRPGVVDLGP